MLRRILVFYTLLIFVVNLSFAKGNTYISFVYGYTPLKLKDFDDHISSLNNMFNAIYDNFPPVGQVQKSIGLKSLGRVSSFESEMRMELARRFEIGILFTYYFTQKESESSVTAGTYEVLGRINTKMTVLNPNLVLYHYLPVSRWLSLELYAGVGYYYAQIPFNQFLSFDHPDLFGQPNFFYQQQVNANLRSHGFGALAGITFEIRLIRSVGILLGARYRYVQMGSISGSATYEDTFTPQKEFDSGTLYYYLDQDLKNEFGSEFPLLTFSENEPVGLVGLRKARLDLTGYTIIIGLRLWF